VRRVPVYRPQPTLLEGLDTPLLAVHSGVGNGKPDPVILIIHPVSPAIKIAFSLLHTTSDINTSNQAKAFLLRYLAGANAVREHVSRRPFVPVHHPAASNGRICPLLRFVRLIVCH